MGGDCQEGGEKPILFPYSPGLDMTYYPFKEHAREESTPTNPTDLRTCGTSRNIRGYGARWQEFPLKPDETPRPGRDVYTASSAGLSDTLRIRPDRSPGIKSARTDSIPGGRLISGDWLVLCPPSSAVHQFTVSFQSTNFPPTVRVFLPVSLQDAHNHKRIR